jgi:glutamate-1-semialdehyde 2,1-aminomutase
MVAGLAAIKELEKPGVYSYVNNLTSKVRTGLEGIAEDLGIPMITLGISSLFQYHFGVKGIKNRRDKQNADAESAGVFSRGLLANGICAGSRPLFLSTAHTQADVDRTLDVAESVLKAMKNAAG